MDDLVLLIWDKLYQVIAGHMFRGAIMKNRERFLNTLNYGKVDDRLPMIEWADWWDKTLARWHFEGLPADLEGGELREYFGLDMVRQFWIRPQKSEYYEFKSNFGSITSMDDYMEIRKYLFPKNPIENIIPDLTAYKDLHDKDDMVVWLTLDGLFWHPRELFGIEEHLYAFYDHPEIMHQMNQDLTEYNIRVVEEFSSILKPDFMTFAEDMSYNHGPMLSYDLFKEFLLPYYNPHRY